MSAGSIGSKLLHEVSNDEPKPAPNTRFITLCSAVDSLMSQRREADVETFSLPLSAIGATFTRRGRS